MGGFGATSKKIQAILDKTDVSDEAKLDELLATEDTVTEVRAKNDNLIKFFGNKEVLKKLIHYATRLPSDPSSHELAHK